MRNLSDIKCPKCKQNRISTLTEILNNGSLEFLVEDGKLSSAGVIQHGASDKVLAACECGHEWVLRKVTSTSDITAERFEHFLSYKSEY